MEPLSRVTDATLDVLEALMGPDDELYGYKVAERAVRKTGVVYPILDRLEAAGWVDSEWERAERGDRGPRRRFYRLNPGGLSAARSLLAERRGTVRQPRAEGTRARRWPQVVTFWPARGEQ
jgi:DNA-binding PadR family transcriptional regulator